MDYSVYYRQEGVCGKYNEKHFHNNAMEIIQIVSGCGTLLVGSLIRNFDPGDILIIDGTAIHCISPNDPEDYMRNKLVVDRNAFLELAGKDFFNKKAYITTDKSLFDEIDSLFKSIDERKNDHTKRLLNLSDVYKLLHISIGNAWEVGEIKKGVISDAIEYITSNIHNEITIDAISRYVHISKFHICRKFKSETGLTINNYIKSTRIYIARQLLTYSDKSISHIAEECGFSDLSTFTKSFKQMVGTTPTNFRKTNRIIKQK